MNDQPYIWVTAYPTPTGDVYLLPRGANAPPVVFTVTDTRGARIERHDLLDAVRASGIPPHFYSIRNPF